MLLVLVVICSSAAASSCAQSKSLSDIKLAAMFTSSQVLSFCRQCIASALRLLLDLAGGWCGELRARRDWLCRCSCAPCGLLWLFFL